MHRTRSFAWIVFSSSLSLVAAGAGGCGDDGAATTGEGAGATSSATGSAPTSSSTGGATCVPACTPPQFCSFAQTCLDPGQCAGDSDCTVPGTTCDEATGTCVPGGGCDEVMATIEPVPPNVLLVLDRSCSMTGNAGGGVTKWEAAVAAIVSMSTTYQDQIRFGLTLFPDTVQPNCAQDAIAVSPGPGNEPAIQTLLTNALMNADPNFPDGPCVTNIDTAMEQASLCPELMDPTRDNFAVLLTDGNQAGCNLAGGDAGTEMILANMLTAGIPTFVIGFGSGIDPVQMDVFANLGGVPNSGPAYYDAADQASLEAALDSIATAAISCTFNLDSTPPDPSQIFVFFDGMAIAADPSMMNGWVYDPATNTITFYGPACDDLKTGAVMDVQVIFGCPVE